MKRLIYFIYYLRELEIAKRKRFGALVAQNFGKGQATQWIEIFRNSLKYNISIIEYYLFGFYRKNLSKVKKASWAGTGYMYEYQLLMNPKNSRKILSDKPLFLDKYGQFVKHGFWKLTDSENSLQDILDTSKDKLVLKASDGQCGRGIRIISKLGVSTQDVLMKLRESGNDMVEEFVEQHPELNRLSSSGLNTLRIITQINKNGNVDLLGVRLRITVNNTVDNLAAGNIAAPVDEKTGVITDTAVYSDITKEPVSIHPVTRTPIIGFKVPFFDESIEMVKSAALLYPVNRSIGWDVAITANGPELIEGNHDWCKLLWQLPVKKGLKPILEKYKKGIK